MTLPAGRSAGTCLHLSALPGDFGIGGLGADARRFVDRLSAMGLRVWQFLPLGPTAYADSPYQPLSVFAGNPLFLDVDLLLRDGLIGAREAEPLRDLPADSVDFARLIPRKRRLLERVAERFASAAGTAMRVDYAAFLDRHDELWLHDYAVYRLLKTQHRERAWSDWDTEFRRREPRALENIETRSQAQLDKIKIVQFLFHRQWQALRAYANERGVRLFGDVPIYVALDSADTWRRPELALVDQDGRPAEVAGVPPDYFSVDGQLWGNPLYDWDYHRATGYRWWIDRLRHATALADMVRLDHFRGFESYWAIPAEAGTARDGHWRAGPADSLFDALKAELGTLPIVAEDLGIITPEVDLLRQRLGFPGMQVLQFLVGEHGFHLDQIPEDCVCYTGTHDNDTTQGWFHNAKDEHLRQAVLGATGGSPETVHLDLMRLAFASRARLAMVPAQDLLGLGSSARFNTPGTTEANWRWRLGRDAIDDEIAATVRDAVAHSARGG